MKIMSNKDKTLHGYIIKPSGDVISPRGFVVSPWINSKVYIQVSLRVGGKNKNYLVSRLVCWVYGKQPYLYNTSLEVDHIDGDKTNNSIDNLQVLSAKDHNLKTNGVVPNTCEVCGKRIDQKSNRCLKCHKDAFRVKTNLAEIEQLYKKYGSWVKAAKSLGISDNALRKRYKSRGGDPKKIKQAIAG